MGCCLAVVPEQLAFHLELVVQPRLLLAQLAKKAPLGSLAKKVLLRTRLGLAWQLLFCSLELDRLAKYSELQFQPHSQPLVWL
jgi:hypothetical protein